MFTKEQIMVRAAIAKSVIDIVNSEPNGCPAGSLYAALMTVGMGLEEFEVMMSTLVKVGKITKRGHQYFPAKTGDER